MTDALARLEQIRQDLSTLDQVRPDQAPPELVAEIDPALLPGLPALRPDQVAWLIAYLSPSSPTYLNEHGAAKWAGQQKPYRGPPWRSRRVAAWIAALLDGQPDAISRPEARAFLSRVVLGEETTEALTKHGEVVALAFPPAARLKALELLTKIDGYLIDRVEVGDTRSSAPGWDLSRLSDEQIEYLAWLEAVATGQDPGPAPFDLVRVIDV